MDLAALFLLILLFFLPSRLDRTPAPGGMVFLPAVPRAVLHGQRDARRIALTFDACSMRDFGEYDERITEILVRTATPATLFLGGKWMLEHPRETRYLAGLPRIELGIHGFLHPRMTRQSAGGIRVDLLRAQEVMASLAGRPATLFRPPFAHHNDTVVRVAAGLGLTTVEYDLASGDPDSRFTAERLVKGVVSSARNGSIILMHINKRGWHTAEALPDIISGLRARGFTLVTVGELTRAGRPSAPRPYNPRP